MRGKLVATLLVPALILTACSDVADSTDNIEFAADALEERLDAIKVAVGQWQDAETVEVAHASAETAANLIVGPGGPGYGDRDGDGVVDGEARAGVLPGLDGTPNGLAEPLYANKCLDRDVLGGSWAEPSARWDEMTAAIDDWRPDNNTMPTLASHPMRVVGWATFTIASSSLQEAHEYAGHAALHVRISSDALDC